MVNSGIQFNLPLIASVAPRCCFCMFLSFLLLSHHHSFESYLTLHCLSTDSAHPLQLYLLPSSQHHQNCLCLSHLKGTLTIGELFEQRTTFITHFFFLWALIYFLRGTDQGVETASDFFLHQKIFNPPFLWKCTILK